MKKPYLVVFFTVFCCVLFSYQWPLKKIVLTALFGESRWTHFHNGIDLGGGEQDIYPVREGEVIFRFEERSRPFAPPSGMGSYLVLEHQQRLRSLYAHLKPGSMNTELTTAGPDDIIGVVGETGGSYGKHLHLTIIDGEYNHFINPLFVLPAVTDGRRPTIDGVYLETSEGRVPVSQGMEIGAGEYPLSVIAYDLSEYVNYRMPMSVYGIFLFLNGEEIAHYTFESIRKMGGDSILFRSPETTFEQFYADDWRMKLGDIRLMPGDAVLEVIVADIRGNETVKSFKIQVVP